MNRRVMMGLAFVGTLAALGCSDSDNDAAGGSACTPACSACQSCDTSGATPTCVDNCGEGLECQSGVCTLPAAATCEPACSACQTCDTSGATPTCVDNCATGLSCQDNTCTAEAAVVCDPPCGDCEMCDTTGETPLCVGYCADGLLCAGGACVQSNDPCAGSCAACQTCDSSHGVPTCVDGCGPDRSCDTTAKVCRPNPAGSSYDHSLATPLQGPFSADAAGGIAVTTECIGCHPQAGQDMLTSAHWLWRGPTPNLEGHATGSEVGKKNLVNNFCVAVPSNEARCGECHAGYGWADKTFDFTNAKAIDCLSCHAQTYVKAKTAAGAPDPSVNMVAAAQGVGLPTRSTCGRCHFNAGGGDNVKNGDLGSALANPTVDVDVHMGATSEPFQCVSCHRAEAHKIPGQGVHNPISEGRIDCVDCHGNAPHATALLNNHALDVACQTCHIPAFSRTQPTKMNWDWATAGDRTRGTNGVELGQLGDGTTVTVYDALKGDFVWEKNVRPSYAWYDGRMTRLTIEDSYSEGAGTEANRINLGGPIATKSDAGAKIFPFKVMRGRQPVDPGTRLVLAPKLFGAGGFWATIPTAAEYTAEKVETNWTNALTAGARYAGQIGEAESFTGMGTGDKPWGWGYTEMWLGINHEVAPKAAALGCSSCHSGATGWDWAALGYTCDPMVASDPSSCGVRHK